MRLKVLSLILILILGAPSFKTILVGLAQIDVHGLPNGIIKSDVGADRGVPREIVLIKNLFNKQNLKSFNLDNTFKKNERLYQRLMEHMYPIVFTPSSNIYLVESNLKYKEYENCNLIGKELSVRVYSCG